MPWVRVAAGGMAALFLLGVVVQYNDPDPLFWMLLYAVAAGVSAAAAAGRLPRLPARFASAALLALALGWSPALLEARPESFDSFHMHSESDERVREAAGLWICAAWTTWLAWRGGARATSG